MTMLKEKLVEAIDSKNNDVNSFVWRFSKRKDGEVIKLMDATPEQLKQFLNRCDLMLNNTDPKKPGRNVLLKIIADQRSRCNTELFLRKLESGAICADGKGYPRHLYLQNLMAFIGNNRELFPVDQLNNISISAATNGLPREFENISIQQVIEGCLDQLGTFNSEHITFNFILGLGVYLTQEELRDFNDKDQDGNKIPKPVIIKKKLGITDPNIFININPSGLSFEELRAMINLKRSSRHSSTKKLNKYDIKYFDMTTTQLTTLRNKVLFILENEVIYHIKVWEELIRQIRLVAEARNIEL